MRTNPTHRCFCRLKDFRHIAAAGRRSRNVLATAQLAALVAHWINRVRALTTRRDNA
jgi:hypothetical protein